jgi:hypothetical protein
MLDDRELIEEGVGFGVPVVKYSDKTFFSCKAAVSVATTGSACTLTKTYTLDTVSLKKIGHSTYINDSVYTPLRKLFERLYVKHKKFNSVFNQLMALRQLAQITTEFAPVKPRGTVTVNYFCEPTAITIQADFSKVTLRQSEELLVLNEQGSNTFQKYVDTDGTVLVGKKIGAWDAVSAHKACLQSTNGQVSFCLQTIDGAKLFRGWERTRNRFSWAGLSYSMPLRKSVFVYSIALQGNSEAVKHLSHG